MPDEQESEASALGGLQELEFLRRRICGLEQEIAVRKPAEQEIANLAKLPAEDPNPVLRISKDCTVLYANDASSIVLQTWQRRVGEPLPDPCCQRAKEALSRGEVSTFEFNCVDGRIFLVTLAPVAQEGYLNAYGVDITERKQKEDKLRQYEFMIESAQDAIFFKDLESRYVVANNKTLEAFGLSRGQVIGKNDYEIMPDKDQAKRNIEDDNLVFRTGKPTEVTKRMTGADGKERWFQAIKVPQFDGKGDIIGLIAIARDITEQKRAQDALQESENKYRDLVEEMTDIVYTLDTQGNVTSVNKAGKATFGREPEEVVGKNFSQWIPPEYLPNAVAVFKRILGGEKITTETVMIDKKGRPRHVEFSSTPIIRDGVVVGTRGIIRDITERKRAEYELQESHKKYRELVDNITDGVYQTDTKGNFTYVNKIIEERSGIPAEKFVGLNFRDVVTPQYHQIVSVNLARFLAGEQVPPFEVEYRTATGQTITVETNVRPIYDGDTITGIQGITRDITQRKKAEKKLREDEATLRSIIDSVTESVLLIEPDGTVLAANRVTAERLGATLGELIGKCAYDFIRDDVAETRKLQVEKVIRTGQPVIFEDVSGERHILHSLNPIKDSAGKVTKVAIFGFDMTEHKQAEEDLRESRNILRRIIDILPVRVFWKNKDSKYLGCNEAFVKDAGLKSADEIVGKSDFELVWKHQAELYRADDKKVLETGGSKLTYEEPSTTLSGDTIWVNTSKVPLKNAEGETIGVLGVYSDITERKKTEEALREAEQKWRCLAENAPDVILTADPDGTIMFMNRTVPPYTPEEAIGTSVYDYVLPEYRDVLRHALEEVVRTSQSYSYELAGAGSDGRTSWYQSRLGPIKQGGQVVAVTLIATDVTERKQAEDALRQSEIKYRTLLENLTQKVFLKDRNSVYISCNENYARDLRIKADQIVGKTDYDFYPKKLAEKYRADDRRIVESGQTTDIEEKYILEGQEFIVHTVKTPLRDEQGNVTGILGIFWDITESKQQERELNLYRERMAQTERLASLGTLSATVAHELTQPLTTIRLSIENSLAQLEATSCPGDILEELKDGLEGVSDAVSVVDRVRNFARQSSEKAITEVNLREVAERIARLLNKNAQRANISVQLKDLEKLPPIYAREKDMEQLFFALADNAIHAADGKRKRQLTISGAVEDDRIELRFADNCGGVAPENLDKIFEPFFTTRPACEGTGLGLLIVQHIVSRAGGKVWVENKPGKGATFFVALPIGKTYQSLGR